MAALSADILDQRDRARGAQTPYVVLTSSVIYQGALVGVASSGFLVPWANTAGHRFVGQAVAGVTGNSAATPPVTAIVDDSGCDLLRAAVTGAVQTSVGALVYSATDNPADLTMSATANVKAVGIVLRFHSAGVADVRLFTPTEHAALN